MYNGITSGGGIPPIRFHFFGYFPNTFRLLILMYSYSDESHPCHLKIFLLNCLRPVYHRRHYSMVLKHQFDLFFKIYK